MPSRSKISKLPAEIQEELNKRLVGNGFSGYEGLVAWLDENGFAISKSALHRHGQEFEKNLIAIKMATEQAKAVVDAVPDSEGDMSEALMRLIQQKAFDQLINLSGDQDISLTALGRMIADISRASVIQKKFSADVRAKIDLAADKAIITATSRGLSPDMADVIRNALAEEINGL